MWNGDSTIGGGADMRRRRTWSFFGELARLVLALIRTRRR
jgi:hypothetical protein